MTGVQSTQPEIETSPLPWYPEPDEREGYEWNVHIVERDRPHMRICFMSVAPNSEANALLIVDAVNTYAKSTTEIAALKSRVEELTKALEDIQAKTNGDRPTVHAGNAFHYWQQLNKTVIDIRERCGVALSLEQEKTP